MTGLPVEQYPPITPVQVTVSAIYPGADLLQWQDKILSQKWEKAFVFFKHEEEAKGPEMAIRFREFTESRVKR